MRPRIRLEAPLTTSEKVQRYYAQGVRLNVLLRDPDAIQALSALRESGLTITEVVSAALVREARARMKPAKVMGKPS